MEVCGSRQHGGERRAHWACRMGQNKSYVFALPPRWIGFYDAKGLDEVRTLMNQNPFQAPCGHKSTQPIANLP